MKTGRALWIVVLLIVCGSLTGLYFLRSAVQRSQRSLPPRGDRNVYILSTPGLRPMHLSSFMYQSIQTPGLDFLAYDGIRFLNAFTTSPESLSAQLSLLTGLYPFNPRLQPLLRHLLEGAPDAGQAGPASPSLPQLLRQRGYATVAFLADPALRRPEFFNTHFQEVDAGGNSIAPWAAAFTPAEARERATAWIEGHRNEKHMVFVDFGEPTQPFRPPFPYSVDYAKHPYDGEIAAVDEQVQRFVHYLKVRGLFERSIIVFESPYGESLGDEVHTGSLNEPIVQSALFIVAAGVLPHEKTYDSPVSLVDVYPTVLQLLDVRAASRFDGVPLFRLGSDQETEREGVLGMTMVPEFFGYPSRYFVRTRKGIAQAGGGRIMPPETARLLTERGVTLPVPGGEEQQNADPGKTLDMVEYLARDNRSEEARELLAAYMQGKKCVPSMYTLLRQLAEPQSR